MNDAVVADKPTRRVSPLLALGIFLVPFCFAWLLLREGHSKEARIVGFGWLGFFLFAYVMGTINPQPTASDSSGEANRKQAEVVASRPSPKPTTDKPVDQKKIKYLEAMEREIRQLEAQPRMKLIDDNGKAAVTAAAISFGLWAKLYRQGEQFELSSTERARQARFRKLAEAAQAEAFPRIRAMQTKVWSDGMWEHDVDVLGSGSGNQNILLRGPAFLSRRGIKGIFESMQETLNLLHYRKITFEPYKGAAGVYYTLTPPPDDQLAEIGDDRWAPIPR